jgi:hypothetical protein
MPVYETIIYAFDMLPAEGPILILLVNAHCSSFKATFDTSDNGELARRARVPHSFLLRAMLRYSEIACLEKSRMVPCDYHGHESDEEKELCKEKEIDVDYNELASDCESLSD